MGRVSHVAVTLFGYLRLWNYRGVPVVLGIQVTWFGIMGAPVAPESKRRFVFRIRLRLHGGRRRRKYVAHNRKFASPLLVITPTSRDHMPNTVRQPPILTWVRRAGWPSTAQNKWREVGVLNITVRQNTREYLISTG